MPVIGIASSQTGLTTAGALITAIRDLIPDPVYDASNLALPDTDGNLFRSQSLYRWISDGIKLVAQKLGWVVEDWNGLAVRAEQPFYALDALWSNIDDAWVAGMLLSRAPEAASIFPNSISATRSNVFGMHKRTDHLEVFLFARPSVTDPSTTITGTIAADGVDPIVVASTTGFLQYGMARIDNELLQYQKISGGLSVVTRGIGGTKAEAHDAGKTIQHCSLWMKGTRLPRVVSSSADVIEIPSAFIPAIQEYVLQQCRIAEQEYESSGVHKHNFDKMLAEADNDPVWKADLYDLDAVGNEGGTVRGRWWPTIIT